MTTGVLGIQILGVLFGLLMVYVSFMHSKRKEFTAKETFFWMGIWIIFLLVTIYPKSIEFLGKELGLSRTMDFLIISGFIMLTGLLFYIYGLTRQNQKKIESVVRNLALEKARKR